MKNNDALETSIVVVTVTLLFVLTLFGQNLIPSADDKSNSEYEIEQAAIESDLALLSQEFVSQNQDPGLWHSAVEKWRSGNDARLAAQYELAAGLDGAETDEGESQRAAALDPRITLIIEEANFQAVDDPLAAQEHIGAWASSLEGRAVLEELEAAAFAEAEAAFTNLRMNNPQWFAEESRLLNTISKARSQFILPDPNLLREAISEAFRSK